MAKRWRMLFAVGMVALACGPASSRPLELRTYTLSYAMVVSWDPVPARAREPIEFRVVVRDKKTKAPIERGEGQIFASSADGINVFDSFVPAAESGTYTAHLKFITAGDWAVGIRFRKDSASKLERPDGDLRLSIHNEKQQLTMRHFHRCSVHPDEVLTRADAYFPTIGLTPTGGAPRSRTFTGELGSLTVTVKMEGGHYTFVEARTNQTGESRLDRNVKRFFVQLHKVTDPAHALDAAY